MATTTKKKNKVATPKKVDKKTAKRMAKKVVSKKPVKKVIKKGLEEECRSAGALNFLIKSKFVPREIVEIATTYLNS